MLTTRPLPPEPDYEKLGRTFSEILSGIIHQPERTWNTDTDLYTRVLREILENRRSGFVSDREHMNNLNGHTVIDRLNAEAAEKRADEARSEADRVSEEAAADLAKGLRAWCNERTVPSRLRREGVELAAARMEMISAALAAQREQRTRKAQQ
jgi:hypothetical protein